MAPSDPTPPSGAPGEVGIVVPTLDEAAAVERNLPPVMATGCPVVVSDGGSRDATVELALGAGAHVVTGPAGRGAQLNRGAAAQQTPVLLFLHADTLLPVEAIPAIREAVAAGAAGGGFLLRFDDRRLRYRMAGRLISKRTLLTRIALGDQGQFFTRSAFDELGGYREWPILEDLDLARRLKQEHRVAVLPHRVTTSARRYRRRGLLRNAASNWLIFALYFLGVPAERLAHLYRRPGQISGGIGLGGD